MYPTFIPPRTVGPTLQGVYQSHPNGPGPAFLVPFSSSGTLKYSPADIAVQAPNPTVATMQGELQRVHWTEGPYGMGDWQTDLSDLMTNYGAYVAGGLVLLLLLSGGKRRR